MPMKNPPHPGGSVLRECIEHIGLTITRIAAFGVTRSTLLERMNENRDISPEMVVMPSKVFDGTEENWMLPQAQYDLVHIRRDGPKLKRLELA